ncbi:TonB-dependent receptor [Massilia eurypsychrophila]|uniref:TonB-dependent receptor n=1 Tax=Massilia eurypsychrophila TaxID=1485217 RepID=A0A2G8TH01_9BURK|nr:TonB-dependent receptor [Massilia eurypsychrophila]PIL45330.1 TonB-dependent receptor [Massilia eurypsychrophila]
MKLTSSTRYPRRLELALLPSLIAAALASMPAHAQQAPAAPSAESSQIETVIVTATKRPAPLQTVPIAITVISGAQLEKSNLNTLGAITSQTPTASFRSGASNKDTSLFIRGVGTISTSPGIEPTVSTVIDGVVTARPGQSTMDLLDVDRVEVLRGPQGTLFGKNASAGVISIVTRDPGAEFGGYVDLGFYQGNEKRARFGVSGELKPGVVRGSFSLMHGDYDGNITNVANGARLNGYDRNGARGKLIITPNPDTRIALIADMVKSRDNTPTGVPVGLTVTAYPSNVVGAPNTQYQAGVAPVVPSKTNRSINSEIETRVADDNSGLSAQVDWNAGAHALTSITAYRKWENTQYQDQDRLPLTYRQFPQTVDKGDLSFNQFTQELRVASPKGQFFDYVGGLFYMKAENAETYRRDVTRCVNSVAAALPSGLVPCTPSTTTVDNGVATYGIDSTSASVFGEGAFNFRSDLRAIAGARYTRDKLSFDHNRTSTQLAAIPGVRPAFVAAGSTSVTGYSGRIGPQFDINRDVMVYATASRGYKGPAYNVFFNMQAFDNIAIKPETSNSYEIGLKSSLLNNRLRLNLAAFNTKYDNYQANLNDLVAGTIVTRLINAGSVSTKGIEMDFVAKFSSRFTVSGAAANIQARIDSFNCPPGASASCDVNGKPLPFSPDWRANLRANYKMPVSGGWMADVGADYNYQSEVVYDIGQAPDSIQPAFGIINATLSLYNSEQGWSVTLVGKNLANKSYATNLVNGGGFFARYVPRDDQRYFGISVRKDF